MATGTHWVPKHRWRLGKTGTHPGYKRRNRPKGKKKILGKKYIMQEIRNESGEFRGWKRVVRKK